MDKTAFDLRYREYQNAVEDFLQGQFSDKPHWEDLYASMRYSLLAGGKRIRPVLALEFARAGRGQVAGGSSGRPAPWRWCIPTL